MEIAQPMPTQCVGVYGWRKKITANIYLKDVLLINIFVASMMQVISEEISRNDCGTLPCRAISWQPPVNGIQIEIKLIHMLKCCEQEKGLSSLVFK